MHGWPQAKQQQQKSPLQARCGPKGSLPWLNHCFCLIMFVLLTLHLFYNYEFFIFRLKNISRKGQERLFICQLRDITPYFILMPNTKVYHFYLHLQLCVFVLMHEKQTLHIKWKGKTTENIYNQGNIIKGLLCKMHEEHW